MKIHPFCNSCKQEFELNETPIFRNEAFLFHESCTAFQKEDSILKVKSKSEKEVVLLEILHPEPTYLQKLALHVNGLAAKNFLLTDGPSNTMGSILMEKEGHLGKSYTQFSDSDKEKIGEIADTLFLRKCVGELAQKSSSWSRLFHIHFLIERERFLELSDKEGFRTLDSRSFKQEYVRAMNQVKNIYIPFGYAVSCWWLGNFVKSRSS